MSNKRVKAEISLKALKGNIENISRKLAGRAGLMLVIKADGYGHGALKIAGLFEKDERVYGYAVATAEEAFRLRENGVTKPILILGYVFPEDYERLIKGDIRPVVFKKETAEEISKTAVSVNRTARIHIKIDTGMSRIGIKPDESGIALIEEIKKLDNIDCEGIFTHFARADEKDKQNALAQLSLFDSFVSKLSSKGVEFKYRHTSNSAAILELPGSIKELVRAGIIIYGLWPSEDIDRSSIELTPVMSLKSSVIYIKEIEPGTNISYGGTYTAKKPMRIATIPVGYADGYPRSLSNKGFVLIRGKRAPIVGRICMDQLMADVTDIQEAREYDEVVLIGSQGYEAISAEELGELSGRFNYELVCDISDRVPRVYTS